MRFTIDSHLFGIAEVQKYIFEILHVSWSPFDTQAVLLFLSQGRLAKDSEWSLSYTSSGQMV